ncbi:response regulator [Spirochaeta cellobiosiphila]|uniref:response regulator n=1 Tax=Spirochaeta cellobiosiphila TaxID=504483 RepID=UPI0003FC8749|nr:response regulator [Spirochaeta cellobiosiphila]
MGDKIFQNATILLVDDQPANLGILYHLLSDLGASVLIGQSGMAALEIAKKRRPDIILLDVIMPDLNGYETCKRLKASDTTKDIPILFISALADKNDKLQAFRSGGVDYITKPFNQDEVLARITAHLTIVKQRRQINFFIKSSPLAIIFVGLEGDFHFHNTAFLKLLNTTKEWISIRTFFDVLDPGDVLLFKRFLDAVEQGDESSEVPHELKLINEQGHIIHTMISLSYMEGDQEVMISLQDVTEKRKLEEQKTGIINQFKQMFYQLESLGDMIPEGRHKSINLDAYGITEKEKEVIQELQLGKNNQEISDSLYVSVSTVKKHLYSIYKKLDVKSRMELVQFLSK